jgi:hypothetical protein
MTRRKPRNRTVTECHKIECVKKHKDGTEVVMKAYVHLDREAKDCDGFTLGPVVGIRVTPDNELGGSLFEEVMRQASELISREVQTVEKVLVE